MPELPDEAGKSPIFATKLLLDPSIDWTAFSVWLSALLHARGDDVLRVKGIARTPAGRILLQSVRKTVQSPEILPEQDERMDNVMVVIGRGYRAEDLRRSLRYFATAERTRCRHSAVGRAAQLARWPIARCSSGWPWRRRSRGRLRHIYWNDKLGSPKFSSPPTRSICR
jgi:hypothetical protein